MSQNHFNRDEMARCYATRHLKTDPGIRDVYYLPADAPEREIRIVEINDLIADRDKDPLEPNGRFGAPGAPLDLFHVGTPTGLAL
jgi:hypothetical protein